MQEFGSRIPADHKLFPLKVDIHHGYTDSLKKLHRKIPPHRIMPMLQ